MQLRHWRYDLQLRHSWAISTDVHDGAVRGRDTYPVVFVELIDDHGRRGVGEAAPSSQYGESHATVSAFLNRVDAGGLSFDDIPGAMTRLEAMRPLSLPALCALNLALVDGAARAAGRTAGEFLGVGFSEGRHVTSLTLGIDTPESISAKASEAAAMPILKIKLGGPNDDDVLRAVRNVSPNKLLRVDANAAWKNPAEALRNIEKLAAGGGIEFVEQPMPPELAERDWAWLKERSPLALMGDESYQSAADAEACAHRFHGVNVKLVKTGGITGAKAALLAARGRGLKTMLGCMIESSVLISAAAHLADLAHHLDLDGNLLITNDPYIGVATVKGRLSFLPAPAAAGLRVERRG